MKKRDYAKRELDILLKTEQIDLKIPGILGPVWNINKRVPSEFYEDILNLCERIDKKYKGYEVYDNLTLGGIIEKVLKNKPLTPITEKEISEKNWINNQHVRCEGLIIYNGVPSYTGAIRWKDVNDSFDFYYSGGLHVEGLCWIQPVKFPFEPKSFYIDIKKSRPSKNVLLGDDIDDSGYDIVDKGQLRQVSEYYDVGQDFIDFMNNGQQD